MKHLKRLLVGCGLLGCVIGLLFLCIWKHVLFGILVFLIIGYYVGWGLERCENCIQNNLFLANIILVGAVNILFYNYLAI